MVAFVAASAAKGTLPGTYGYVDVAYAQNVVAGNLLVAAVMMLPYTRAGTLTDSQGNTWAAASSRATQSANPPNISVQIFYAIAGSSAACTVHAVPDTSISSDTYAMHVLEFSGYATTSVLDGSGTTASGGPSSPSSSITTGQANSLIVAATSTNSGAATAGANYTMESTDTFIGYQAVEYDLDAGAAGSITVNFTDGGAGGWALAAAAFKVATGGSPVSQDMTGLVGAMTASDGDMATALSNYYFLGSDVTVSGWTTSSGTGSLASMLNEATPDDGTYAQSAINPSADIAQCEWLNVSPPDGNTNNQVSYRIWGDGGVALLVELIAGDGTTVIGGDTSGAGWLHDPAPSTPTQYDKTLSTAEADAWAAAGYVGSRLRVTAG